MFACNDPALFFVNNDYGFFAAGVCADLPVDAMPLSSRVWFSDDVVDLLDRSDYSTTAPCVVDDVFCLDGALAPDASELSASAQMEEYFAGALQGARSSMVGVIYSPAKTKITPHAIGYVGHDAEVVDVEADPERVDVLAEPRSH